MFLNTNLASLIITKKVYKNSAFSVAADSSIYLDFVPPDINGYDCVGIKQVDCGGAGLAINQFGIGGMRVNNPRSYKIDVAANTAYIEFLYVRTFI